ncbi:MAG: carboxymuconolactone decarboxylase family protein [Pseudomonadota bacterium]
MHVPVKKITKYPLFIRAFFWKQKRTYGEVLKPGMLWARSPLVFATLALLYGALNRKSSPIDAALRSLVTVRVSQINHCAFCIDINSATLLKRGVSMEKIEALSDWRSSEAFSAKERIALDYAEAITHSDKQTHKEMMDRLKLHFDDDAIVELTGLISFQNMSSKFNAALDVPPGGFCLMPDMEQAARPEKASKLISFVS